MFEAGPSRGVSRCTTPGVIVFLLLIKEPKTGTFSLISPSCASPKNRVFRLNSVNFVRFV